MSQILITEKQLRRLLETGSNSAAMDLDIYTTAYNQPSDNGNLDSEETIQNIIDSLNELLTMVKTGKEMTSDSKTNLAKAFDLIDKSYSDIKFVD
jgi:endonuclease IV